MKHEGIFGGTGERALADDESMKLYLATPHTLSKFRGGAEFAKEVILQDENIFCGEHYIPEIYSPRFDKRGGL